MCDKDCMGYNMVEVFEKRPLDLMRNDILMWKSSESRQFPFFIK